MAENIAESYARLVRKLNLLYTELFPGMPWIDANTAVDTIRNELVAARRLKKEE